MDNLMSKDNLKLAREAYLTLCEMLDDREWHYEKNDTDLSVYCGVQGDDLGMDIYIDIDRSRQLVSLISPMPYVIPENRRAELAVAVSLANNGFIAGGFDYNYQTGKILFRLTSSFRGSLVGKGLFSYILSCACYTIDEYNDKFLVVSNNEMTIDEIMEYIK